MLIKLNTSGFLAKAKAMQARTDAAARAAILAYGDAWTDEVERIAPRSTCRYVRAWQEAMVSAGGRPRSLVSLRANPRRDDLMEGIVGIANRMQAKIDHAYKMKDLLAKWFTDRNPPRAITGAWATEAAALVASIPKLEGDLVKMERKLKKAMSDLAGEPSAIVMGVLYGNVLFAGKNRKMIYVRGLAGKNGAYGGTGQLIPAGQGRVVIRLTNREPHSAIVEHRDHVAAMARDVVKAPQIVTAKRVIRRILKGLPAHG